MNYTTWNLRTRPGFKEENTIIDNRVEITLPSIKDFRVPNVYDKKCRSKIISYFSESVPLVATTYLRKNAYSGEICSSLSYFTDSEVIFDNLFLEYIKESDFCLPVRWYDLIAKRDFKHSRFEINFDLVVDGSVDIFATVEETFDEDASIKKALIWK